MEASMFDLLDLPTPEEAELLLGALGIEEVGRYLPTLRIVHLIGDVRAAMEVHFKRYGISPGRFTLLMLLLRSGGRASPSELADRTRFTRSSITGLIDTLEKDGFVHRERDTADRRRLDVVLTDAGRARFLEILPDHFRRIQAFLAGLSDEDLAGMDGVVAKIRAGLPVLLEPASEGSP
jgi:DNA-binding MarR family transcriptional regulator